MYTTFVQIQNYVHSHSDSGVCGECYRTKIIYLSARKERYKTALYILKRALCIFWKKPSIYSSKGPVGSLENKTEKTVYTYASRLWSVRWVLPRQKSTCTYCDVHRDAFTVAFCGQCRGTYAHVYAYICNNAYSFQNIQGSYVGLF